MVVMGSIAALFSTFDGPSVGAAGVAITSWALSEYYIRIRRMALPSTIILLAFTCSFAFSAAIFYVVVVQGHTVMTAPRKMANFYPLPLFEDVGSVSARLGMTGLIVGGAMLLLTAYWGGARALLVRFMPRGLAERLPAVGRGYLNV